jgi:RNA polymerase sigma-70 factor (ECF subfamily)
MNATPPAKTAEGPPDPDEPEGQAGIFDAEADDGDDAPGSTACDGDDDVEALAPRGRSTPGAELAEEALVAWIERIVDRDERALAALYDATLSRVYGLVMRVVRRAALADEVVEDTYFQVWRTAVRFDPARGSALAWLLGMARSRAIDAIRRDARFKHDSLDADSAAEVRSDTPPPDELLSVAQGHAELHRALMMLNAQPRQLVALAFFRGLSHEDIALETALPLGTVKSQIRRALITLRKALDSRSLPLLAS